jgi:hypothetical protein
MKYNDLIDLANTFISKHIKWRSSEIVPLQTSYDVGSFNCLPDRILIDLQNQFPVKKVLDYYLHGAESFLRS